MRTLKYLIKEMFFGEHYFDFSSYELKQAIKQYIPLQFHESIHIKKGQHQVMQSDQGNLIDFFLEKAFPGKDPKSNCFLVFADAGMGKTTFILNLYYEYTSKFRNRGRKINLFSLAKPSTLNLISGIKKKEETILLLDGFDEDSRAIIDFDSRFQEICEATKDFNKVIITTRKNLFCKDREESFEQYIFNSDPKRILFDLRAIYIASISVENVAQYITESYSLKDGQKRRRVVEFIKKSELLMERPILLSYLDELISSTTEYAYTYQIYETMVESSMEKEDLSLNPRQTRWFSKDERQAFYRSFALTVHKKQRKEGGLHLDMNEFQQIAGSHHIKINSLTLNNKSLLSYNSQTDKFKFAHRSILEYFLAKEAYDSPVFLLEKPFIGRDEAQRFYQDMILNKHMVKIENGGFTKAIGESDFINPFYLGKYPVKVSEYLTFCEMTSYDRPKEPSWGWNDVAPIVNVSRIDAIKYCEWMTEFTGMRYRLPTLREWDFAALGGSQKSKMTSYAGSNDLDKVGWYAKNAERRTQAVGTKAPNLLGIYDLTGNAWEWCQNIDTDKRAKNGTAVKGSANPDIKEYSFIKGGSWLSHKSSCHISTNGRMAVETQKNMIGFRVVIEIAEK